MELEKRESARIQCQFERRVPKKRGKRCWGGEKKWERGGHSEKAFETGISLEDMVRVDGVKNQFAFR